MEIVLTVGPGVGTRQHVPQELGNFAIAAGLAKPFVPVAETRWQDILWGVTRGQIVGDKEQPPAIHFHCRSCGNLGSGSPSPERVNQQNVRCPSGCVGTGNPPPHIANEYLALRKDYLKRQSQGPRRVR
jgi:hypothetical protein